MQVIGFQKNSTITAPLNDVRLLSSSFFCKDSVAGFVDGRSITESIDAHTLKAHLSWSPSLCAMCDTQIVVTRASCRRRLFAGEIVTMVMRPMRGTMAGMQA